MKTCSVCGKELTTSVDEYGDPKEPVCREHWFNPQIVIGQDFYQPLSKLEREFNDLLEESKKQ